MNPFKKQELINNGIIMAMYQILETLESNNICLNSELEELKKSLKEKLIEINYIERSD